MVGVPRSKGCRICVQRRVKCDQTRPTCNNCKKGNRPCPGYGQDLKFQDEGARLRKRFETSSDVNFEQTTSANHVATDDVPMWPTDLEALGGEPVGQKLDIVSRRKEEAQWDVVGLNIVHTNRRTFLGLLEGRRDDYASLKDSLPTDLDINFTFQPSDEDQAEFINRFLFKDFEAAESPIYKTLHNDYATQNALIQNFQQSLYPEMEAHTLPKQFRNHAKWLTQLPPMTGTNLLLDSAVRAVTLVHIGKVNTSEPFVLESRPYYGSALRLLNQALQSKSSGMSNETLCAVILLSFYEMFASDNNDSWVRHAGGVSALMRARGPTRHTHGFDREIFLAYRYTLIIEAFQEDVPCFLAEPGWIKLSKNIHAELTKTSGVPQSRLEIFNVAEEYYQAMVILPGVCAQARAIWQAKQQNLESPYDRAELLEKMVIARANFRNTFAKFEAALKRSGHAPTISFNTNDPLMGIEFQFINTFVASTYVGYWTVLIVLNLCLQGIQHSDPEMVRTYQTESREASLNICRASAYMMTSTFLGPFFLIFGLRVGLIVFEDLAGAGQPDKEADWILRKLFEIGEKHMSIAKHVPGYHAGITVEELIGKFRARKGESQGNHDRTEITEFARKIATGDVFSQTDQPTIPDEIPGVTPPSRRHKNGFQSTGDSSQNVPSADDYFAAWNNGEHDSLRTNMDNLNIPTNHSRSSTSSPRPPLTTTQQQQQFNRAATTFLMSDMSFVDPTFGMEDVSFPQEMSSDFLMSGSDVTMSPSKGPYCQTQEQSSLHEPQEAEGKRLYESTSSENNRQFIPSQPKRQNTLPRGLERFFT